MRKQGKKRIWKAAGALLLSTALALSAPVSYLPEGLEVSAAQADENGFVIENGILKEYTGTATEVVIPEGVTSIGDNAFEGCSGLTSINIPSSVTNIGYSAFSGCSGLNSIVVEEGNTVYDSRKNCNAIIESSSNTLIAGCKNTVIPSSVEIIGGNAFRGCNGLTSIVIPSGVTGIGYNAFSGCSSLTSIKIPTSVMSIRYNAFSGCSSLTSISIPEGVTSIEDSTFSGCSGLTSISIPSSVTSIGSYAFSGCSGLTSIVIPSSVTSVMNSAFINCSGLTSIAVEEGNTVYDSRGNCNAIIKTKSNALIAGCKNTVIPSSVKIIGWDAFRGCNGLTSIVIPSGVTGIGDNAFMDCSGLTSIVIPSGVTDIGDNAFMDCSGLTSINIPSRVTSIGSYTFRGCSGLTSINIPSCVTSIGSYAFSGCSGLTSISIPSSVTSIWSSAFEGCSGLTSIVVEKGNTVYDSRGNCNAIIETKSNCLKAGCSKTVIPTSVTSIGSYAFSGCSGLTSISIPSSVTSIGSFAFEGCSGLTSIVVEEGNTVYDSRGNCNAIIETKSNRLKAGCSKTVIPTSVTSIGDDAFRGCSSLTSINIPSGVTGIGDNAFEGCSGLTSIKIPTSVMSIGYDAFRGCSSLTSIEIPSSVTSIGYWYFAGIGDNAFEGCKKLTIYGEEGSYAQTYAKQWDIPFRWIGGQDIFTEEKLAEWTEENKTQDTVIETSDGLTFTFKKGTMDLVDGMDFYDFGAEITEDYASLPNQAFTEDEFAFRINFNHSGKLLGEAQITIPAGSEWAGKRLYYYEINEDGTYSYMCRSTVAADGSYTVKQSHCSSYVATTKVPENLGDCDGEDGITSKDALAILKYSVGLSQEYFIVELADCDGEDGITSKDALEVLKYSVGLISEFK